MRINVSIELRRPARHSVVVLLGLLLLGAPAVALAGDGFPDVSNSYAFHDEIGAIAEAGITAGFSDGTYRPSNPVTRGAMAAFMHRGLGRTGLAIGADPMTPFVSVGNFSLGGAFAPVRQLTITVPGASNAFSPTQLVHLQGRVHFWTQMNAAQGCPCEFTAFIRDMTTNAGSLQQTQTFESSSSNGFFRSFDVEALFAAPPGPRTYQLEVRLSLRESTTNAATFALSDRSSLSAMTFPFGPIGTSAF